MSSRLAPWLLCVACAYPLSVSAQSISGGSISGYVYDEQRGAVAGVTITATSPDIPLPRQTVSTPMGAYRLGDLPPGTYTITAEHPGFARFSQMNIRVGAGLNLGLEIVLPLADVSESVEVRHNPPMLEVARPGQRLNISGEFQNQVPLTRRRDWAQFAELTPGVIASNQVATNQNYFFHGSSTASHVLQLDGMDVTSAQAGSNIWINLNTDAVTDVQVKTAATDASVPLGTGIVANVVTRSGTNDFQGIGSVSYQNRHWNDSNTSSGSVAASSLVQSNVSLGGPIQRDRAWFFGSYRYTGATTGISRSGQQVSTLAALVPTFQPFDNHNQASFAMGKISQQLTRHHFVAASQYDRNPSDSNTATDATPLRSTALGGWWHLLRLSSLIRPNTVSTVSFSYNTKGQSSPLTALEVPSRIIYERVAPSSGGLSGINALATLDNNGIGSLFPYTKLIVSGDISHTRYGPFGSHDLQAGLYWHRQVERNDVDYANDGVYRIHEVLVNPGNPSAGSVPFARLSVTPSLVTARDIRTRDLAAYLQDNWGVGTRVTLALGVRVDAVSRYDRLFALSLQRSIEIGPRLGVTVALDTTRRQIVHAAFGRVHDALPSVSVTPGTATPTTQTTYDLDRDGSFETVFVAPGATQLSANRRFDGALHQPYVTEATLGYRWQLWRQSAIDVSWLSRSFRRSLTQVEVNGIYDGAMFKGYKDESQNEILLATNNRWNWPVYQAATIQLTSRSSRASLLASYTRQWQRAEGTWQPNDPSFFLQPDAFADDRYQPSSWRDHTIRVGGTINAPAAFQLALDYTLQAGRWSGPVTTTLSRPDATFGPSTIQLSNGRVVQNPLATTTRFAYQTRGTGQLKADNVHSLNVRVSRAHSLPWGRLDLIVDIFNVSNAGADQSFVSTNNASNDFGAQTSRQLPRAAQLGARISF